jgi:hypothetical protein
MTVDPASGVPAEPGPRRRAVRGIRAVREHPGLRWLLALALSGVIVLGATHGMPAANLTGSSLPPVRSWSGCATGAPRPPATAARTGGGAPAGTLVIADDADDASTRATSKVYGVLAANLASHFGPVRIIGTSAYTPGLLSHYQGGVYIGTASDQMLPYALRHDVRLGTTPLLGCLPRRSPVTSGSYPDTADYSW